MKIERLILTTFLSLGLVFMACEQNQKVEKEAEVSGKSAADTSESVEEREPAPSLSELEEGKTAIEGRLESLLTLLEEKQRALMAREEELYKRERALVAKAAHLNDREQRLARLRIVSWMVLALGIVGIIAGLIISRRTPGQPSSQTQGAGAKAQKVKQEFVKNMETELATVESKITEMKKKAESAKEEAKKEYQKQIRTLQGKRTAFKKKLKDVQDAGEGAWEELRAGVQKAAEDLKKAADDAASKLK